MFDDAKNLNVYDEKFNDFVDMSPESLGMNSEVEQNFGMHPFRTDYLLLSGLNKDYVRKNLREAQSFLKDEENYAYKNILDRSLFFMCDSSETPQYNCSRNDKNLKLARIIFRFKRNLDLKYDLKPAPLQVASEIKAQPGAFSPEADGSLTFDFMKYPNLAMKNNFMTLLWSETPISQSIVQLSDSAKGALAV